MGESNPFERPHLRLDLNLSTRDMLAQTTSLLADTLAQRDAMVTERAFLDSVVEQLDASPSKFRPVNLPRLWRQITHTVRTDSLSDPDAHKAVLRGLVDAELFWVSDEMARLASDAATDLPEVHLGADLWPADSGFMVFQWPLPVTGFQLSRHSGAPRSTEAVRALSWAPGGDGILITMYADMASVALIAHRETRMRNLDALRDFAEWREEHGELMALGVGTFPIDEPISSDFGDQEPHIAILLSTCWLLMQQPLMVEQTRSEVDPKTARRMRRANERVPEVTLIELRRFRGTSTAGSTGRNYEHRWAVRGHWRRQWYPSLGMHRPTWVRPHVKGPDGKPFMFTDKVKVWKR